MQESEVNIFLPLQFHYEKQDYENEDNKSK